MQRPTAEIEDNINQGRTAFVTAGIAALRGGMPIRVNGKVVGRCCRPEQGDRHRNREKRGGGGAERSRKKARLADELLPDDEMSFLARVVGVFNK